MKRTKENYLEFISRITQKNEDFDINEKDMDDVDKFLRFLRKETSQRKNPVVLILEKRFGLNGQKKIPLIRIAKKFNLTYGNASQIARVVLGEIRKRHLKFFVSIVEKKSEGFFCHIDTPILEIPISKLGFSVRTYNCLRYQGKIKTLEDLVRYSYGEILRIDNFGMKSLEEVKEKLSEMNLALGMNPKWVYEE